MNPPKTNLENLPRLGSKGNVHTAFMAKDHRTKAFADADQDKQRLKFEWDDREKRGRWLEGRVMDMLVTMEAGMVARSRAPASTSRGFCLPMDGYGAVLKAIDGLLKQHESFPLPVILRPTPPPKPVGAAGGVSPAATRATTAPSVSPQPSGDGTEMGTFAQIYPAATPPPRTPVAQTLETLHAEGDTNCEANRRSVHELEVAAQVATLWRWLDHVRNAYPQLSTGFDIFRKLLNSLYVDFDAEIAQMPPVDGLAPQIQQLMSIKLCASELEDRNEECSRLVHDNELYKVAMENWAFQLWRSHRVASRKKTSFLERMEDRFAYANERALIGTVFCTWREHIRFAKQSRVLEGFREAIVPILYSGWEEEEMDIIATEAAVQGAQLRPITQVLEEVSARIVTLQDRIEFGFNQTQKLRERIKKLESENVNHLERARSYEQKALRAIERNLELTNQLQQRDLDMHAVNNELIVLKSKLAEQSAAKWKDSGLEMLRSLVKVPLADEGRIINPAGPWPRPPVVELLRDWCNASLDELTSLEGGTVGDGPYVEGFSSELRDGTILARLLYLYALPLYHQSPQEVTKVSTSTGGGKQSAATAASKIRDVLLQGDATRVALFPPRPTYKECFADLMKLSYLQRAQVILDFAAQLLGTKLDVKPNEVSDGVMPSLLSFVGLLYVRYSHPTQHLSVSQLNHERGLQLVHPDIVPQPTSAARQLLVHGHFWDPLAIEHAGEMSDLGYAAASLNRSWEEHKWYVLTHSIVTKAVETGTTTSNREEAEKLMDPGKMRLLAVLAKRNEVAPGSSLSDPDAEVKVDDLNQIIKLNSITLNNLFQSYAIAVPGEQPSLQVRHWKQLCSDAGVSPRLLSLDEATAIFTKCRHPHDDGTAPTGDALLHKMTSSEFTEGIVRIADGAFPPPTALSQGVTAVFKTHLLNVHKKNEIEVLKELIASSEVQRTLKRRNGDLQSTFNAFAKLDHGVMMMEFADFLRMSKECNFITHDFNYVVVQEIFTQTIRLTSKEDAIIKMHYAAFCDAIVVLALYKQPSPFLAFARRLDLFIVKGLMEALKAKTSMLGKMRKPVGGGHIRSNRSEIGSRSDAMSQMGV